MKERNTMDPFVPRSRACARSRWGPRPPEPDKPPILLVSEDAAMGESLRYTAALNGRAVVQADDAADALHKVRADRPAIVLLDLDLPSDGAWEAADSLLLEESCPPLILLTARSGEFDIGSAIRAGSLVDKTSGANHLLHVVDQTLATPRSAQAERNAIQRIMIRWLKPSSWPVPVTPAHRFWGINE
jgi:DNA-binding response OmpR family regulator